MLFKYGEGLVRVYVHNKIGNISSLKYHWNLGDVLQTLVIRFDVYARTKIWVKENKL